MRESLASPHASCRGATIEQAFHQRRARKAHVLRRCPRALRRAVQTPPGEVAHDAALSYSRVRGGSSNTNPNSRSDCSNRRTSKGGANKWCALFRARRSHADQVCANHLRTRARPSKPISATRRRRLRRCGTASVTIKKGWRLWVGEIAHGHGSRLVTSLSSEAGPGTERLHGGAPLAAEIVRRVRSTISSTRALPTHTLRWVSWTNRER